MLEYIQYPWQRDIEARMCNLFNVDYISSDEEEEQEEDDEEEGHHLPGPPVQEVRPRDHLGEKKFFVESENCHIHPLFRCCGRRRR